MRVLALDQAKKCGWAVYDNGALADYGCETLGSQKDTYENILVPAFDFVNDMLDRHRVDVVVFEDIQQQQSVTVFKKLAMLMGAIILGLTKRQILFDIVPPTKWKSFCGVKGRKREEQKANAILFAQTNFKLENVSEDMADAICIGYYAVHNITVKLEVE